MSGSVGWLVGCAAVRSCAPLPRALQLEGPTSLSSPPGPRGPPGPRAPPRAPHTPPPAHLGVEELAAGLVHFLEQHRHGGGVPVVGHNQAILPGHEGQRAQRLDSSLAEHRKALLVVHCGRGRGAGGQGRAGAGAGAGAGWAGGGQTGVGGNDGGEGHRQSSRQIPAPVAHTHARLQPVAGHSPKSAPLAAP